VSDDSQHRRWRFERTRTRRQDEIRTAQGREAVDALLKHFEHHEQRSPPDVRFDFNDTRRDLGLPA